MGIHSHIFSYTYSSTTPNKATTYTDSDLNAIIELIRD